MPPRFSSWEPRHYLHQPVVITPSSVPQASLEEHGSYANAYAEAARTSSEVAKNGDGVAFAGILLRPSVCRLSSYAHLKDHGRQNLTGPFRNRKAIPEVQYRSVNDLSTALQERIVILN